MEAEVSTRPRAASEPADAPPDAPAGSRRLPAAVPVLACCGAAVPLTSVLPVPLLPELPRLLHTTLPTAAWTLTAALLAAAVCTPVAGRLGDMYGKRLVLVCSLAALLAGSVMCGLANSVPVLLAGRTLQGCAAGILPLSLGIARDLVTADRLGAALAQLGAAVGVAGAAGFPLAAAVAQFANWHVVFWMAAGIAAADLAAVLLVVPPSASTARGNFDWLGAAGLAAGLVCLLLAISQGGQWGWGSGRTVSLFAAAAAFMAAWSRLELRVTDPLVDLRTTASRAVLLANVAAFLVGFAMFAMSLILPELLQAPRASGYGSGMSLLGTGLCIAPAGLTMLLLSPASARVSARWGASTTLVIGAGVICVGYAAGALLLGGAGQVAAIAALVGTGLAFTYSAMPALILAAVPPSQSAAAGGVNLLIRSIGAAACSAMLGSLMGALTITVAGPAGPVTAPSAAALRIAFLIGCCSALGGAAVAGLCGTKNARPAIQPH
jgi:MFS family permease